MTPQPADPHKLPQIQTVVQKLQRALRPLQLEDMEGLQVVQLLMQLVVPVVVLVAGLVAGQLGRKEMTYEEFYEYCDLCGDFGYRIIFL